MERAVSALQYNEHTDFFSHFSIGGLYIGGLYG